MLRSEFKGSQSPPQRRRVNTATRSRIPRLQLLGGIVVVVLLLTAMMGRLLYGTALGHSVLDSVPDEAWDTAHRMLGAGPFIGVEDRQNADALVVFVICLLACSPFVVAIAVAISRQRDRSAPKAPSES